MTDADLEKMFQIIENDIIASLHNSQDVWLQNMIKKLEQKIICATARGYEIKSIYISDKFSSKLQLYYLGIRTDLPIGCVALNDKMELMGYKLYCNYKLDSDDIDIAIKLQE